MNNKIKLFSCLVIMFFLGIGSNTAFSQKILQEKITGLVPVNSDYGKGSTSKQNNVEETKVMFEQIDGTFQIQILKEDYKVLFSKSLHQLIIEKRQENDDVYVSLDENLTLFIPSYTKIKSDDYIKLPQTIFIKK